MDTATVSLLSVILSGQLVLTIWTIIKEVREIKEKKKKEQEKANLSDAQLRNMVFRLYRNSMEAKIINTHTKLENDEPDLREYLRALQDDMECYIDAGGNGIIRELYLRLCERVRKEKGESYYVLLLVDAIHASQSEVHS